MKQTKKPTVRRKGKEKEKARQTGAPRPWLISLRCILFTVLIGALGVITVAVGLCFLPDPGPFIRPFALLIAGTTALLGGYLAGRKSPQAPLLSGTVNGLLLTALMLLGSLVLRRYGSGYAPYLAALLHAGIILLSLLGSFLSQMRSKKARSRSGSRS